MNDEDMRAGEINGEFNIHSQSRDARARLLSSLANRPFEFGEQMFASFEGFFQGIKFSPGSIPRKRAFASSLGQAKRAGIGAVLKYVWWGGEKIGYGSRRHKQILELALRASMDQNTDRMEVLLATSGLKLIHVTGEHVPPDHPFPPELFCRILTEIREEALR